MLAVMTVTRALLSEVWQILLPTACAGCDAPGAALCPRCAGTLRGMILERRVESLRVASGAAWDDTTARIMRAFKRDGPPALVRPLGAALAGAVARVTPEDARVALVPVPSTRSAYRRRGFRPVELLMRGAALPAVPLLAVRRGVADQRRLGRAQRTQNMLDAFGVVRAAPANADGVVLIDDVVTSGATMHAAQRVLEGHGVRVFAGATALATPRRISQENDR